MGHGGLAVVYAEREKHLPALDRINRVAGPVMNHEKMTVTASICIIIAMYLCGFAVPHLHAIMAGALGILFILLSLASYTEGQEAKRHDPRRAK